MRRPRIVANSLPRRVYARLVVLSLSLSVVATVPVSAVGRATESITNSWVALSLLFAAVAASYTIPALLSCWILRNVKSVKHVLSATAVVWFTWSLAAELASPILAWSELELRWGFAAHMHAVIVNIIAGVVVAPIVVSCSAFVIRLWLYSIVAQTGSLCWRCGYDCNGVRGPICPECGLDAGRQPRGWLGKWLYLDPWYRRTLAPTIALVLFLILSLTKSGETRTRYAESLGLPASSMSITVAFIIVPDAQFGQTLAPGIAASELLDEERQLYLIRVIPFHDDAEFPAMHLQLGIKSPSGYIMGIPFTRPPIYGNLSKFSAQQLREHGIPTLLREEFLRLVDLWIADGQSAHLEGGERFGVSEMPLSLTQQIDADSLMKADGK